ncbi:alpha/beta-type small acid-soluble spore protein [Sulfobacillus thermosulfidooxidans]|uniref:alpha/beta-type small acid-soluble spore protein n=1 Tax=Sulfobacillus thermosulfidooxidans TaxID=28034 RepID=UPI00096B9C50|nr:alpha/beta-type small acid-soluble spore protein [Sulfobacillus thermosulfidooxidans]OLZ12245.1 spore protein alpha/beta [Sulfobacillus thermosulfidooxidans]OLZ12974.1 spore protein alpha/beta [Sulfobacillus thermosulfidooxidans]OLZ21775.1 spore protein alpha/beta [Sulfobacillus thermosulfidooxidans]
MSRRKRGPSLLPESVRDQFKYEIASDLGLSHEIAVKGWADMPTRQLGRIGGKIGGNMVKVMIREAEKALEDSN